MGEILLGGVVLLLVLLGWDVLCLAPGYRLMQQNRPAAAYRAFEVGLRLIPRWKKKGRAVAMIQLAQAAHKTGQLDRALRWTEQVVADRPGAFYEMLARSTASAVCGEQGRHEEADRQLEEALALTRDKNEEEDEALYWGQRAGLLRRQGKLAEAVAACERAEKAGGPGGRAALPLKAECLCALGRPEEALQILRRAYADPLPTRPDSHRTVLLDRRHPKIAALERQMRAIHALSMSLAAAEAGRAAEAMDLLPEARAGLSAHEGIGPACEATEAWLLALLGRREEALRKMAGVDELLPYLARQTNRELPVLIPLARAADRLEDFERSAAYLEQFLALKPDLVPAVEAWYRLGECRLRQGNREAARAAFQQAAASTDAEHARRARSRLDAWEADAAAQANRQWWLG